MPSSIRRREGQSSYWHHIQHISHIITHLAKQHEDQVYSLRRERGRLQRLLISPLRYIHPAQDHRCCRSLYVIRVLVSPSNNNRCSSSHLAGLSIPRPSMFPVPVWDFTLHAGLWKLCMVI